MKDDEVSRDVYVAPLLVPLGGVVEVTLGHHEQGEKDVEAYWPT
ncbi:lasso RiPP family leader peptide-containing protein [Streptomyces monticola]|uniref:Lasso RiPP family leader peptide-containing protein n=1 Tax=Streptomyces monticola TaxID=2666263 RepID=A0ABW2JTJ2_9ACTN